MREKIEFIGRSWKFPLGGNGDRVLIKMEKKNDETRKEQKHKRGKMSIFWESGEGISERRGEGDGVA